MSRPDPDEMFERERQLEQLRKDVERAPVRAKWQARRIMALIQRAMVYLLACWLAFVLIMLLLSPVQLSAQVGGIYQAVLRSGTFIGLGVPLGITLLLRLVAVMLLGDSFWDFKLVSWPKRQQLRDRETEWARQDALAQKTWDARLDAAGAVSVAEAPGDSDGALSMEGAGVEGQLELSSEVQADRE